MTCKPILFSTDMVRAILAGQKTQTRRAIKPQPTNPRWNNIGWLGWNDGHGYRMKPPCEDGDVLWVRETWSTTDKCGIYPNWPTDGIHYIYKADDPTCDAAKEARWYPSVHMPKEAARIFLRAKDVRVDWLHAMDEETAIAEGFSDSPAGIDSPLTRFAEFWDKTIKREDLREFCWSANPWVWVIEFERCEKPEGWDAE